MQYTKINIKTKDAEEKHKSFAKIKGKLNEKCKTIYQKNIDTLALAFWLIPFILTTAIFALILKLAVNETIKIYSIVMQGKIIIEYTKSLFIFSGLIILLIITGSIVKVFATFSVNAVASMLAKRKGKALFGIFILDKEIIICEQYNRISVIPFENVKEVKGKTNEKNEKETYLSIIYKMNENDNKNYFELKYFAAYNDSYFIADKLNNEVIQNAV